MKLAFNYILIMKYCFTISLLLLLLGLIPNNAINSNNLKEEKHKVEVGNVNIVVSPNGSNNTSGVENGTIASACGRRCGGYG